jgi:hypothetical protein
MRKFFENLKGFIKKELVFLWIFGVLAGFALIVLENKNKLPLGKGDFVFLAVLALLVALYKPRWIFFLFVAAIPLENIILVSGFLPVQLRPYQFLGGMLIVAVTVLFLAKRLKFKILKPIWLDWFVFSLVPTSFLSAVNASNQSVSLKNNLILTSFVLLYFLARNFLRVRSDFAKTAFFFLGSFIVVSAFGFYQVLADKFGGRSFEVMFGRPNSTFAEPDWLGIYLVFSLAVFFSLIFFFLRKRGNIPVSRKFALITLDALIFLDITLIVLVLSRSAWIGAGAVIVLYLLALMPSQKDAADSWKKFFREAAILFFIVVVSLVTVHFGKLSKFDVFDRARSATTSEQKITIACESDKNIPQIVGSAEELAKFGCRHINLEEIETQKSQGKMVAEIFRKDPNVMTRGVIYRKSWEIIRAHPVLGVGFGTITQKLGADERGAGLNESNIFLQVWAGCGILGLLAFVAVLGYIFVYAFRRIAPVCPLNKVIGCPVVKDDFEKTINVFAVLAILALVVPNLFNAGLFMGIFWLGLGTLVSCICLE